MSRYFSYDPAGNEIRFHDTAAEAEKEAESALELYREDACDSGWDESVGNVCWGEVKQRAVASQIPAEEGATFDGEPVTHWTHYEITDTSQGVVDRVAVLQALLDAKFTPEQQVHLEDAKAHLREFVRLYGPYGTLAVALLAPEFTDEFLGRARASEAHEAEEVSHG